MGLASCKFLFSLPCHKNKYAYIQARGTATLDKPPAMPLFDCQQRIKKLAPTLPASTAPALVVSLPVPVPAAAPQVPATSTSSITELLLHQLLQTQQMTMHTSHSVVPHQQALLTPTPQVPAAVVPLLLPPSPAKH